MNSRLNISDLAGLLSETTGKNKEDIERFLKSFVEIVTENLYKDKSVVVDELGIFMLTLVEERESVDVNTGQRILIPRHYKFSFHPDQKLKDSVNKPFSVFETIELKDNVDFSSVEDVEDQHDIDEEDQGVETVLDQSREENEIVSTQEMILENYSEEGPLASMDNLPQEKKDAQPLELELKEEESVNPVVQEEISKPEDVSALPDMIESQEKEERENKLHQSSKKKSLLVVFLILLLASVCAFFYLGKEQDVMHMFKKRVKISQVPIDTTSLSKPDSLVRQAFQSDTLRREKNIEQPIDSVKIMKGDRLTSIALKRYGNKLFWVYLYLYNKSVIEDPNNVPIGTIIKIPAAGKYDIDANNPDSRKRAAALQTEILSGNVS